MSSLNSGMQAELPRPVSPGNSADVAAWKFPVLTHFTQHRRKFVRDSVVDRFRATLDPSASNSQHRYRLFKLWILMRNGMLRDPRLKQYPVANPLWQDPLQRPTSRRRARQGNPVGSP